MRRGEEDFELSAIVVLEVDSEDDVFDEVDSCWRVVTGGVVEVQREWRLRTEDAETPESFQAILVFPARTNYIFAALSSFSNLEKVNGEPCQVLP